MYRKGMKQASDFGDRYTLEAGIGFLAIVLLVFYIMDPDQWSRLIVWALLMMSGTGVWRDITRKSTRHLLGKWYGVAYYLSLLVCAAVIVGIGMLIAHNHVFKYYATAYTIITFAGPLLVVLLAARKLPRRQYPGEDKS